jgi:hypothetical protein
VARALGRDHDHVEVGARLDQAEMDVEAMGEGKGRALLHIGMQVVGVDRGLMLVGREDHDDVGPGGGFGLFGSTLKPAPSAFLAVAEPGRRAIATSLTPLSRRFWAWA